MQNRGPRYRGRAKDRFPTRVRNAEYGLIHRIENRGRPERLQFAWEIDAETDVLGYRR